MLACRDAKSARLACCVAAVMCLAFAVPPAVMGLAGKAAGQCRHPFLLVPPPSSSSSSSSSLSLSLYVVCHVYYVQTATCMLCPGCIVLYALLCPDWNVLYVMSRLERVVCYVMSRLERVICYVQIGTYCLLCYVQIGTCYMFCPDRNVLHVMCRCSVLHAILHTPCPGMTPCADCSMLHAILHPVLV